MNKSAFTTKHCPVVQSIAIIEVSGQTLKSIEKPLMAIAYQKINLQSLEDA